MISSIFSLRMDSTWTVVGLARKSALSPSTKDFSSVRVVVFISVGHLSMGAFDPILEADYIVRCRLETLLFLIYKDLKRARFRTSGCQVNRQSSDSTLQTDR